MFEFVEAVDCDYDGVTSADIVLNEVGDDWDCVVREG